MRSRVVLSTLILPFVFLAFAGGCGPSGPKPPVVGKVGGTVTLDGKPLPKGTVVTLLPLSAGTEGGAGEVLENGTYHAKSGKLDGMPVGDYLVKISPPRLSPKEEEELSKKNLAIVIGALQSGNKKLADNVSYPQEAMVPRKYWHESTSGFKATVLKGDNTFNFELVSKGDAGSASNKSHTGHRDPALR